MKTKKYTQITIKVSDHDVFKAFCDKEGYKLIWLITKGGYAKMEEIKNQQKNHRPGHD